MNGPSPYISLSEAGKISGYTAEYLRQLCVKGKLEGVKIGKSWVTTQAAVTEFKARQSGEPLTLDQVVGTSVFSYSNAQKLAVATMAVLIFFPVAANLVRLSDRAASLRDKTNQLVVSTENAFNRRVSQYIRKQLQELGINPPAGEAGNQEDSEQPTVAGSQIENPISFTNNQNSQSGAQLQKETTGQVLGESVSNAQVLEALRTIIFNDGLPQDLKIALKGEKGDSGAAGITTIISSATIPNSGSVFGITAPTAQNPGTIGSATYLSAKDFFTETLTVTGNITTSGSATLDSLSIANDASIGGDLTVMGITTLNGLVIANDSITSNAQATFTKIPTLAHMFVPSWPAGTSNGADGTVYINPASSVGDGNLLVAAVGGAAQFVVDAEGDVYANNLILSGSTSTGATTISGNLVVQDNTTLGDALSDITSISGKLGIGTTAPITTLHIVNTVVDSSVIVDHYGDGRIPLLQRGANGTPSSPTVTLSGDLLGGLLVGGHNSSALTGGRARIAIVAAQNWSTSANGTYISFSTNTNDLVQPNGTERMRISDAGFVGIGTTNPAVKLEVTSTSNAMMNLTNSASAADTVGANLRFMNTTNYLGGVNVAYRGGVASANIDLDLMAGGESSTPKLTIEGTGNVGIGTTNPTGLLNLHTTADSILHLTTTTTGTTAADGLILEYSDAGYLWNYENAALNFATNNTQRLSIGATGFLTQTMTENTAVSNTTFWSNTFGGSWIRNVSNTVGTVAGIGFANGSGLNALSGVGSIQESSSLAALGFFTGGSGTSNTVPERVRITSGGNVGIGTTNPAALLHLAATNPQIYLDGSAAGTQDNAIRVIHTPTGTNDGGASWRIYGTSVLTTNERASIVMRRIGVVAGNNAVGDYPIIFSTAAADAQATEKMRILGNGNVGIGTTNPVNKFEISSSASNDGILIDNTNSTSTVTRLRVGSDAGWTYLSNNWNATDTTSVATSGTLYHTSRNAAQFILQGGVGVTAKAFSFLTAAGSGTQSTTEVMTILGNGSVGIGTTGPTSVLSFGTDAFISRSTVDAADSGAISIGGGGAASVLRGAFIEMYGNENAQEGALILHSGKGGALGTGITKFMRSDGGGAENETMRISPTGFVGIGTTNPGTLLTVDKSGLATTGTDGITLQNSTAATALVPVQISPRLRFRANVWNTTTAANNTQDWYTEVLPTSSSSPTSELRTNVSFNGAGVTGFWRLMGGVVAGPAPTVRAQITNGDNTTGSSNAELSASVGGDNSGDPLLVLSVSGSTNWSVGLDNSDSDKFKIGPNLAVGTSTALTIDTSGFVGIGTTTTSAARLTLAGSGTTSATKSLIVEDSAGTDNFAIRDDGASAVGKASLSLTTNTTYSNVFFGADFSGTQIITNSSGNGITALVSGVGNEIRFAGSNEFSQANAGHFVAASINTNAANVLNGVRGSAIVQAASGRATTLRGGDFLASTNDASGGTFTNVTGIRSIASVTTAGATATNLTGLLIDDFTIGGTATNTYGIRIGDVTTGTQTNTAYSLFASDANALNYFAGKVGIGTTNPAHKFQISGSGASATSNLGLYNTGTAGAYMDISSNNGSGRFYLGVNGSIADIAGTGANNALVWSIAASADLLFGTANAEKMRITSTGNVGIGTTTISAKLHSLATTEQLRLGYDDTNYTGFSVDSGGDLSISSSGGEVRIISSANLVVDGNLFSANGGGSFETLTIDGISLLAGDVAIGTTDTSTGRLVVAQTDAANLPGIYINTEESTNTQSVFSIETDSTVGSGADTLHFKITADGSVFSDANIYSTPADVAEMYFVQGNAAAGDVVEAVPAANEDTFAVTKATGAHTIMGVISTAPGPVMNYDWKNPGKLAMQKPVALVGRVPVKVSEENGAIHTGDRLTVSGQIPGHAAKMTQSGQSIGIALEDSHGGGSGTDEILVFVNLGYQKVEVAQNAEGELVAMEQDLDLGGHSILNVKSIASLSGKWSISDEGLLVASEIHTEKLCVGLTCVTEEELKTLLQTAGLNNPPAQEPSQESMGGEEENPPVVSGEETDSLPPGEEAGPPADQDEQSPPLEEQPPAEIPTP